MSAWGTGDVAMVTARWIRTDDHSVRYAVRRAGGWISRASINVGDHEVSDVRPLVVIDPEDAEQVKRLDDLLERFTVGDEIPQYEGTVGSTRAALREFANPTPPKPDEPTGLGAVVEDDKGTLWVRLNHEPPTSDPWKPYGSRTRRCAWGEVPAVRVLSEGVQP